MKNKNSNELLLTILNKPGGLDLLLKLSNLMGVDTSRKNLNVEQLEAIQKQDPNELLLSILDKPEGLDTLIQVAELGGINLPKDKITAEKIKEAVSSYTSQETSETQDTLKPSNSISSKIQHILSQHVSAILGRVTTPNVSSNLLTAFTTILPLQNITRVLTSIFTTSPQNNVNSPSSLAEKQIHALKNLLIKQNSTDIEKNPQKDILSTQGLQALSKLEGIFKNKK
ncbi:hypothetical protein CN373_23570 [Bacillus cereus]|uniref:hypothetical protein n=1 Tax=Bacillus cereus TaxID=1396 RepID=UPI000BF448A9|nr:hypothetical protein [Bacillus cereus]PFA14854.1 hypothetical protein CN373_23570 [Bacillus cereus]